MNVIIENLTQEEAEHPLKRISHFSYILFVLIADRIKKENPAKQEHGFLGIC